MEYKIVNVRGHVEVYDSQGQFLFSADTEAEALEEVKLRSRQYAKRLSFIFSRCHGCFGPYPGG